jgi:hypothetical protein
MPCFTTSKTCHILVFDRKALYGDKATPPRGEQAARATVHAAADSMMRADAAPASVIRDDWTSVKA